MVTISRYAIKTIPVVGFLHSVSSWFRNGKRSNPLTEWADHHSGRCTAFPSASLKSRIAGPTRALPPRFKPYGRGMLVGLMFGLGAAIVWAPRFTTLPSYAGFLGFGLVVVACVLAVRERWMAEAEID